jgi:lysine 6-dehydrogenase
VDIHDEEDLVRSLEWADACLKATTYYANLAVMKDCLKAGVHYTDMGGLFCTTRNQIEFHDRFKAAGISAVLCVGSAPGVPNIQTRYAADRLDTIESIKIFDGVNLNKA